MPFESLRPRIRIFCNCLRLPTPWRSGNFRFVSLTFYVWRQDLAWYKETGLGPDSRPTDGLMAYAAYQKSSGDNPGLWHVKPSGRRRLPGSWSRNPCQSSDGGNVRRTSNFNEGVASGWSWCSRSSIPWWDAVCCRGCVERGIFKVKAPSMAPKCEDPRSRAHDVEQPSTCYDSHL